MTPSDRQEAFPAPGHNHQACIADALDAAEEHCKSRGLRFTPLRRRVLEIVWNRHAQPGLTTFWKSCMMANGARHRQPYTGR